MALNKRLLKKKIRREEFSKFHAPVPDEKSRVFVRYSSFENEAIFCTSTRFHFSCKINDSWSWHYVSLLQTVIIIQRSCSGESIGHTIPLSYFSSDFYFLMPYYNNRINTPIFHYLFRTLIYFEKYLPTNLSFLFNNFKTPSDYFVDF